VLDGVKSLSYASNMLASRLAREQGFDEALLVTPHGRVLEAPTSSIFWIKDGEVLTPPLSEHILASITRALVVELTGAAERECTLEDLFAADEAFLASTTREAQPIAAIDDHTWGETPASAKIAAEVSARIQSELGAASAG
jgi:branched-chain amino acid aminotransferase